jgi:hypothetical protein
VYDWKSLQVIGSEGGYRRIPTPFLAKGLFIGVAERYEVRILFGGIWEQREVLCSLSSSMHTSLGLMIFQLHLTRS